MRNTLIIARLVQLAKDTQRLADNIEQGHLRKVGITKQITSIETDFHELVHDIENPVPRKQRKPAEAKPVLTVDDK